MKLFVGVPAYDRCVSVETARSLLNEQGAASLCGVEFMVSFAPGSSLVTHARDHIARDFLASGADRLIYLDSDVAFDVGTMLRLARHEADFVGGCYRYKDDAEGYPILFLDRPELWADPATGLIEVAALPGGFLSLSRAAIERMVAALPGQTYQFHGESFPALFHCPRGGGEDGAFCNDWRALGGSIWLDPTLTLTHVDAAGRKYTGCIGDWLKGRGDD